MNSTVIIIIGIVLIVILLVAIITSSSGGKSIPEWKKKAKNQISRIEKEMQVDNHLVLKNSLIEADKLLDFVLKEKRVAGQTLGERLKSAKHLFGKDDYNAVWTAHKLRNQLVHEIDSRISNNYIKAQTYSMLKSIKKLTA